MQALRSHEQIRDVNTRYHDVAAATTTRSGASTSARSARARCSARFASCSAAELDAGFASALEIGAGTGYFSLNLMRAGVIGELTCTDISTGHGRRAAAPTPSGSGSDNVRAIRADAESLPFADESFDLVLGHAVLHHLPDLDRAFAEFRRVLRPGGRIVFAGEPSRVGDRIAGVPKRAARPARPALAAGATRGTRGSDQGRPRNPGAAHDHELEGEVDIHAFAPADLAATGDAAPASPTSRSAARSWSPTGSAGSTAGSRPRRRPDDVPMWWRRYAFHGYLRLQRLDERALEPRLPPALFYNLLLTARRPAEA